jgi:DNA-binding CsgD family transcriptional regulator
MNAILSPREIEILQLVSQGLSNREIAKLLDLAPKTIEHLLGTSDPHRGIYPKIGVTNRTEAAAWYVATCNTTANTTAMHQAQETANPIVVDRLHKQLIEVYSEYQSHVTQLRNAGQPQLAISMADFLITKTGKAASHAESALYQKMYLRISADALIEKGTAYLETMPRTTMVQSIKPLTIKLKSVSKRINDRNSLAMANVILAGAFNIQKHYEMGRRLYLEAYEQANDIDMKLRILRGVTIAATYLHDKEMVNWVIPLAEDLIAGGHFTRLEQLCETCEGIGRGQGLLGSDEAFTWFDRAEQTLRSLNHPPLRTLQLLISKQEVIMHMDKSAVSEIERLGKQALGLAEQYGYHRHKETVLENLRKTLDL